MPSASPEKQEISMLAQQLSQQCKSRHYDQTGVRRWLMSPIVDNSNFLQDECQTRDADELYFDMTNRDTTLDTCFFEDLDDTLYTEATETSLADTGFSEDCTHLNSHNEHSLTNSLDKQDIDSSIDGAVPCFMLPNILAGHNAKSKHSVFHKLQKIGNRLHKFESIKPQHFTLSIV
jgi:hypothetical protein